MPTAMMIGAPFSMFLDGKDGDYYRQFLGMNGTMLWDLRGKEYTANVSEALDHVWATMLPEVRGDEYKDNIQMFKKARAASVEEDLDHEAEFTDWSAAAQVWRLMSPKERKTYESSFNAGIKVPDNSAVHPRIAPRPAELPKTRTPYALPKRKRDDSSGTNDGYPENTIKRARTDRRAAVVAFLSRPGVADISFVNGLTPELWLLIINRLSRKVGMPSPLPGSGDGKDEADAVLLATLWKVLFIVDVFKPLSGGLLPPKRIPFGQPYYVLNMALDSGESGNTPWVDLYAWATNTFTISFTPSLELDELSNFEDDEEEKKDSNDASDDASAADWTELPERAKAVRIDDALDWFSSYFRYSTGKRANKIVERLETAFKLSMRPRLMIPAFKALPIKQEQRDYWRTVLRPLLTDKNLFDELVHYELKTAYIPAYIIKSRREAVEYIQSEDYVNYFDEYFRQ